MNVFAILMDADIDSIQLSLSINRVKAQWSIILPFKSPEMANMYRIFKFNAVAYRVYKLDAHVCKVSNSGLPLASTRKLVWNPNMPPNPVLGIQQRFPSEFIAEKGCTQSAVSGCQMICL